jgi:hypothetical protein
MSQAKFHRYSKEHIWNRIIWQEKINF